jgi:hypothetical protein
MFEKIPKKLMVLAVLDMEQKGGFEGAKLKFVFSVWQH